MKKADNNTMYNTIINNIMNDEGMLSFEIAQLTDLPHGSILTTIEEILSEMPAEDRDDQFMFNKDSVNIGGEEKPLYVMCGAGIANLCFRLTGDRANYFKMRYACDTQDHLFH